MQLSSEQNMQKVVAGEQSLYYFNAEKAFKWI